MIQLHFTLFFLISPFQLSVLTFFELSLTLSLLKSTYKFLQSKTNLDDDTYKGNISTTINEGNIVDNLRNRKGVQ